jgi:hypothetical protein
MVFSVCTSRLAYISTSIKHRSAFKRRYSVVPSTNTLCKTKIDIWPQMSVGSGYGAPQENTFERSSNVEPSENAIAIAPLLKWRSPRHRGKHLILKG